MIRQRTIFIAIFLCICQIHLFAQTRNTADCETAQTSAELNINNVRAKIHSIGDMWWDLQGRASYEVPKGGGVHPMFAGAIWIGGKDEYGQKKVATMLFRQNGVDFWPGPLTTVSPDQASTSIDVCRNYDKMWSITREEVEEFRNWWDCSNNPDCSESEEYPNYVIPQIIIDWPAHGPEGGYDHFLAPFWDNDEDGYYNPYNGDFPYFEFIEDGITDDPDCNKPRNKALKLHGDQAIWYVFNDKGNLHENSGGDAMGIEIRAVAYAYTASNEINDMTFYQYEIINRSTKTIYEAYVSFWTDVDMGFAEDDYIGFDVQRGLGYAYNGDDNDDVAYGWSLGYGEQPPAIGIDIFEGLYKDADWVDNSTSYDTIDDALVLNCAKGDILNGNINGMNFQDGTIDNERWGATKFIHLTYCSGASPFLNMYPYTAEDYYNYMSGFWMDGTQLSYGGIGHYSGGANMDVPTSFIYPGNPTTDPCGWGQGGIPMPGWSEETEGFSPGNRRFIMSTGPVSFEPGAVNNVTMGVVYARAQAGGPWASVVAMQRADDKAQALFNNCFHIMQGPDAPELNIIESDKKIIVHILNKSSSNNYIESYTERNPELICDGSFSPCDEYYNFQGYQIFQLKDNTVDFFEDKHNDDLVRQVFQCDIQDEIVNIMNFYFDNELEEIVPQTEVEGENNGIYHSFVINQDMFASENDTLVNQKEYLYTAIAYAYNTSMAFTNNDIATWHGNKEPYIYGENNVKTYSVVPHINGLENHGTILATDYGFSPNITMIEGHGNANNIIELTEESIAEIMYGPPWKATSRTYKNGQGPISVQIIDPLNIPKDTYTIKFIDVTTNSSGIAGTSSSELSDLFYKPFNYVITNSKGDEIISEDSIPIGTNYEQLFPDWGFSISVSQENFAGVKDRNENQNGFLSASIEFADEEKPWLNFIPDGDNFDALNWIRLGVYSDGYNECTNPNYNDLLTWDPNQYYEKILGGTWAPYRFTSSFKYGPALSSARNFQNIARYEPISSVDLVITDDKSMWTKCCVVEMCENEWETDEECGHLVPVTPTVNYLSVGNAHRFALRKSPSVDKDGNSLNDGTHGMGWFPGYAIDMRTGERLNIVFGEDSWLIGENGNDMIWNPSSGYYSTTGPLFGGKHYIYIMGNNQNFANDVCNAPAYDECAFIYENLLAYETGHIETITLKRAWTSAMWCAIPYLNPNYDFMVCDVKIKLRVATPYHQAKEEFAITNPENDNLPMFSFSTEGLQAETHSTDVLVEALDIINIVPNPYYWGNHYGNNTYNDYVRIINLPQIVNISIYTSSGKLVNKFTKNNSSSFYQWDMKDKYGNLIQHGMYIFHIEVPGVGERVIKWFGSTSESY